MGFLLDNVGRVMARYLEEPADGYEPFTPSDPVALRETLRPGDVLLIEGNNHIAGVIKYFTQSTWSHAALYIGAALPPREPWQLPQVLVEADLEEGVRAVPLARYATMHTRICRAVGLSDADRERVVQFVVARLGLRYDLKNVVDLARYLLPTPPVPTRYRRRMLALGSGDPTRAICSTLIAQAFQSVRYPILPEVRREWADEPASADFYAEIYRIRHHSLFAPRDFDISPYFQIVKPTIETHFDYHTLKWDDADPAGEQTAG